MIFNDLTVLLRKRGISPFQTPMMFRFIPFTHFLIKHHRDSSKLKLSYLFNNFMMRKLKFREKFGNLFKTPLQTVAVPVLLSGSLCPIMQSGAMERFEEGDDMMS
jgi:hypothetical protein